MKQKPILLDGAFGTSLCAKAEAKGYDKVPVWRYNIEHPELIDELVREYAAAGSKMIQSNTFGANGPTVKRVSSYSTAQVVKAGVEITKKALEGTDVKTSLSIGPLSMLLEPYGDLEEDECREYYEEMIGAGMDGKADAIIIETFMDLEMMKIAASIAVPYGVPVYCTMTFEKSGRTMMGNSVEDVVRGLEPLGIAGVGMNCSLGPDLALPIIQEYAAKTELPLIYKPNAGLPVSAGGTVASGCDAVSFAKAVEPAFDIVSLIGGCCGSDPSYIREISKLLENR